MKIIKCIWITGPCVLAKRGAALWVAGDVLHDTSIALDLDAVWGGCVEQEGARFWGEFPDKHESVQGDTFDECTLLEISDRGFRYTGGSIHIDIGPSHCKGSYMCCTSTDMSGEDV